MMDTMRSLSDSISALAAQAAAKLFHVPSILGGRTGLSFDGKLVLVPAAQAGRGDRVELLGPGGAALPAEVRGFDPGRGLAVLELATPLSSSAWSAMPDLPTLGSLVLVAAYPSPQGPEARLDLVRFAGGAGDEAYIQTDGAPFPGFAGAALVAADGLLAGVAAVDRAGNRGWALPAARAAALAASIAERGFPGRAWMGVSTVPIDAPPAFAARGDDRASALMVAGLERGGPAETAGIMVGDLLASIGGAPVRDPRELREALDAARPGQGIAVSLLRAGEPREVVVVPTEAPAGEGPGRGGPFGGEGRGHGWGPWRGWGFGRGWGHGHDRGCWQGPRHGHGRGPDHGHGSDRAGGERCCDPDR